MAGYIKGITIEFGADTSKLNNALKKTNGTINKTQAELKQINRSLKFNPGNTALLQQKFKLLQQQVEQTRGKLNQLREMQKKMDAAGIDKNSAQYRELQREIIKTENQLKRAEGELRRFGSIGRQQALAVGSAFKAAGAKIRSAGRTITTAVSVYGIAGIYAGKKLIDMSEKQAQAEQKLAEIYKSRMGVGKKAVQSTLQLASAEQKAGVVGDEVQLAAAQQLATYTQYPGTVNKMLPAINDLLVQQKGLNGTQEDATALANLFGKAMMGQTGALKRAGISFTEAQEKVLKYGTEEEKAAMIAEVVKDNIGDMNEAFAKTDAGKIQQAKNALGDMGEQIGAVLLPAVADLVSWFQANLMPKLQQFIDFMKQHPQIATFALALASITAVAGPLIMVIGGLISAIGTIITFVSSLGPVFTALTGPIGLVIAAIAAAIAIGILLYKNWDKIKAKLTAIWKTIKTVCVNTWNAIKAAIVNRINEAKARLFAVVTAMKTFAVNAFNGIKSRASAIFNAVKTAITHPIETAKNIIKRIIDKIKGFFSFSISPPHIPLPHFAISPPGWKLSDLLKGSKPSLSIDWYAKGGIFNRPTIAGIGENGAEAVVPLNKFWDKLDHLSGETNIVINVTATQGMNETRLAKEIKRTLINEVKSHRQAWA